MIDDEPVLTYGVVDGRFVMGTDSNTLLGIDNAEQASLANDAHLQAGHRLAARQSLEHGLSELPADVELDQHAGEEWQ